MPNESDSEHDADEIAPEPERLGPSDERSDPSARTGNARAPHTPADVSDWIESLRDIHFTWNERGPAGESARSPGDDWLRSLDGELHTEIDAEPTSDTTGSREAGEWWRTPDEQLAFARNSPTLPAESDGLTRAAEPAGDAGAAGPAGVERGRRGAWVLAGFAALAILVAGTASAVVVSRSDGSRPAGKIVSDRTTAPTTTTVPVTTTTAPAPETSVPASPAPPAAPTAPVTTTTSRRAPPANPGPAVMAPVTPPPPTPDTTPPPPDTTLEPPDTTLEPPPST
jgi:hypothetical protein